MWWRAPLRRAYFGLIGLLLFTVAVFAGLRYMEHGVPFDECRFRAILCLQAVRHGSAGGPLYLVWQGGIGHGDYWPIAVALLGAAALVDAVAFLRARRTER